MPPEAVMRHGKTVIVSALVLFLTPLVDTTPAEAQFPGGMLRPLTAPLRMIMRGVPRARHARPYRAQRAYRMPRAARATAVRRSREATRRQLARGAAGTGVAGAAGAAAAFWPIGAPDAFEDMLGYAFWPQQYGREFWSHGPRDILRVMIAPAAAFAQQTEDGTSPRRFAAALVSSANAAQSDTAICIARVKDQAMRPLDRLEDTISLSADQQRGLQTLRDAIRVAIDGEASACRGDLPATQPERLRAMINGLWAMRYAEFRIRPALDTFYGSLTDAQKQQLADELRTIDAGNDATPPTPAAICGEAMTPNANPFGAIERVLRPTDEQRKSLQMLYGASMEMAQFLTGTCPAETPTMPADRLSAASDRVMSLLHAAMGIEPLLGQFYGSLSDDQRRRFNATVR
jgi:hypothetical protein